MPEQSENAHDILVRIIQDNSLCRCVDSYVTATAEQADEGNGYVRAAIAEAYGEEAAESVTIQYGGSMNAKNCDELVAKNNVDGGLIGGASLKAEDFSIIVKAASK